MPDDPTPDPKPDPTPPAPPPSSPPPPAGGTPPADPDQLGAAGKAALDRERQARKEAEKAQREMKARLDALEAEKLSESEKLQREALQGRELAAKATQKLREANLLTALAESGLTGPKAKAAVRLLDSIEYDDGDEPTNLPERIEAAKATFGAELFQGATPPPAANGKPASPARPDVHQGPRRDAEPDEDEQFAAYMKQHFPQVAGTSS